MRVVHESDFATVWVYPELRIIHHKFHKFMYGEGFRQTMLNAMVAFEKYKCNKWLSDDRENSVLKKEDFDWAIANWEPRVLKAGWRYWALVLPNSVLGQMNMRAISERYIKLGVTFKSFNEPDDGLSWLKQQL